MDDLELFIDMECDSCQNVWATPLVKILDYREGWYTTNCTYCGSSKTKMIDDSLQVYIEDDLVYIQRENGNPFGDTVSLDNLVKKLKE